MFFGRTLGDKMMLRHHINVFGTKNEKLIFWFFGFWLIIFTASPFGSSIGLSGLEFSDFGCQKKSVRFYVRTQFHQNKNCSVFQNTYKDFYVGKSGIFVILKISWTFSSVFKVYRKDFGVFWSKILQLHQQNHSGKTSKNENFENSYFLDIEILISVLEHRTVFILVKLCSNVKSHTFFLTSKF